jgi:glycosyltransferase involved in cell wall biosynthesis
MIFKFQKYINPINYFNVSNKEGKTVFPKIQSVSNEYLQYIDWDYQYSSSEISEFDASWQLVQKGYVAQTETLDFDTFKIPIVDEYRFIKKNYHPIFSLYVLIIRMITFHNPFKEIYSFLKNYKVKRINVYDKHLVTNHWDTFKSILIESNTKVSVIIPTLNRYDYLKDVLHDLEKQDYKNFDVIVIDQTEPFQNEFYNQFNLDLKVEYQEEKALWLARNKATKISNAEYLLFFDDDSRVEPNWISNHLKALDFFNVKISSGTSISVIGAKVPQSYSYFKLSDQIDTGNVMIHRDVFKKIGLYDRQFEKQRMGDGEFGMRAYLNGFINISNPKAQRLHLKVESGGLRQMGSWDGFRPKNFFSPRPIPSVLYLSRKYFGSTLSIYYLLVTIPPSIIPYRFKGNSMMLIFGSIVSVLIFPFVLYQVFYSWRNATKKLEQGEMIEYLN